MKLLPYLRLETFTAKLKDEDWISIAKIFLKAVGKLLEREEGKRIEEVREFINGQELDELEKICYGCLTSIENNETNN